jgi:hypothetical protein
LVESCENYEIFDADFREELLFKLVQHFAIGGSMSQYEDNANIYIEMARAVYKDLLRFVRIVIIASDS